MKLIFVPTMVTIVNALLNLYLILYEADFCTHYGNN